MVTLDERDMRILAFIKERKVVRMEEIRSAFSGDGFRESLDRLKNMGYITSIDFTGARAFAITNDGMRVKM